jgi:hypothetical protein
MGSSSSGVVPKRGRNTLEDRMTPWKYGQIVKDAQTGETALVLEGDEDSSVVVWDDSGASSKERNEFLVELPGRHPNAV